MRRHTEEFDDDACPECGGVVSVLRRSFDPLGGLPPERRAGIVRVTKQAYLNPVPMKLLTCQACGVRRAVKEPSQ